MSEPPEVVKANRYQQIIEHIFFQRYHEGDHAVEFVREDIEHAAQSLHIAMPKNIGDVLYTFRYRGSLPPTIRAKATAHEEWIIRSIGRAKYAFVLVQALNIVANMALVETKIPDATPGIIKAVRNTPCFSYGDASTVARGDPVPVGLTP